VRCFWVKVVGLKRRKVTFQANPCCYLHDNLSAHVF
jgi:hypothetical protein